MSRGGTRDTNANATDRYTRVNWLDPISQSGFVAVFRDRLGGTITYSVCFRRLTRCAVCVDGCEYRAER